ncbi:PAS domain-containing protein [Escherichia coli]|nr:PAS domain-containing protein [Escherichia coli]
MGSCAAPSAKGDDKFITTDYLQQCQIKQPTLEVLMRQNLPVTGRNLELPKDANILSTTSPQSHITYVNPDFIKISGFTEEELLGQPHNIVRHPDMPPAAFEHMWSTLKSGRSWMGLVKNRCKNGDHYWVSAYVTPIAKNGSIVEYQSVRTKPEPEQVLAAEKLYAQLRSGKAARPKLAASFSVKILLLIWGSIISSAMAAGMLTDTSISSLLLPGINAFTRCRSLTSIALSGSRIVTANQTDS